MLERISSRITASRHSNSFSINQIEDSNTLLYLFSCIVIIVLICIAIGHYAFKNGLLTCDHFVFNTYLYVILAIMLMFLIVLINDQTGIFNKLLMITFSFGLLVAIIAFIGLLALIYFLSKALITTDPNNILASNTIWLALVALIGILMIPVIYLGALTNVIGMAGMTTVAIVIIVGLLGYYAGDKIITFDWDYYLNIALMILIGVLFLGYFFISSTDPNVMLYFIYITSIIGLIIFILLLLSNHKRLREDANKCAENSNNSPNYPFQSWQLVIKIANVFSNLVRILAIRKLRGRR